jgi:hypothetical protein
MIAVTTATWSASAADDDALFRPMTGFRQTNSDQARVRPTAYRAYRADLGAIRAQLSGSGTQTIAIPAPTGETAKFQVVEDSVMEPELQAAHPELRTYAGIGPAGSTIRLDVTPMGFHAMVRNPDGRAWYVDPATNRVGEERVLSYFGGAVPRADQTFVEHGLQRAGKALAAGTDFAPNPGGIVSTRTYRLAFLTDSSYASKFGDTDMGVFIEKTALINRVNEVYNDDLAVKFVMVAGTDTLLNFSATEETGANGPCGANACFSASQLASCGGDTLDRNEFVLGQVIGAENYDIGHIGLGKNGGGIAGLGVVGGPFKADGCTGLPNPTGDFYAIDYVAHEIGHQMGGDHTFNGTQANCSPGNRNTDPFTTQVEPGSGSSIMAYAGICSSDNLQPHSDPYFSFASVDQINATTAQSPSNENEQQVVNFSGLDSGEQFTLSCAGCPTSATITFGSPTYTADVTAAVQAVSGQTGTISGYDGALTASAAGFTVDWNVSTADIPTLTVTPVSGTFTTFTGTPYNGGPTDEQGVVAASANNSPVVTAPADKTIPIRTPFTLTGSATDAQAGDTLTYMWEQTDPGGANGTGLVSNTKVDGPLFRQFGTFANVSATDTLMYHSPGENLAGTDPSRTFPDLAQILAGNTNAATGTCPAPLAGGTVPVTDPALNCFSEFLPTADWVGNPAAGLRVMHFRLTARDEFTPDVPADHAGGLSFDGVALTVDPLAGPFLVTSRATTGSASGTELVTWDVAGTDAASLAPNVKISLSTDGGLTYPTVLAATTANDGSEPVLLPNVTTSTARIKVEAVDNYFFDINDADFSISPAAGDQVPLVDAGPNKTVAVGTPFTSVGGFADESPGSATATVDYGDGAGPQPLTLTGSTFTLSHTYTAPGSKTVTVKVTDAAAQTGTDTMTVTVTQGKLASGISAKAKPKKVTKGHTFKVKATVTAASAVPTGVVEVYRGNKRIGSGTLANGKVTIKISKKKAKKLKVGKNTLTAKYLGSATISASQVDVVIKVKKKKKS